MSGETRTDGALPGAARRGDQAARAVRAERPRERRGDVVGLRKSDPSCAAAEPDRGC
jgi:hypothetical protein